MYVFENLNLGLPWILGVSAPCRPYVYMLKLGLAW